MTNKKEDFNIKILKESVEKYVKLDIEMSNLTIRFFVEYANKNMTRKEKEELLINWAFTDILIKQVNKESKNGKRK